MLIYFKISRKVPINIIVAKFSRQRFGLRSFEKIHQKSKISDEVAVNIADIRGKAGLKIGNVVNI